MHFATISFFEFGQFLRIVLWIALPMVMLSLLVTVYIHYSRKTTRKGGQGQSLPASGEGSSSGELSSTEGHLAGVKEPSVTAKTSSMEKRFGEAPFSGTPEKMSPATAHDLEVVGETVYQGLLWMKNKYEQDREQSTAKYMQLKEEHGQLKEKYQGLETRHSYNQELLNERQSTIDRLRGQLQQETLRTAEVKSKLETSSHLLLKIHKELDQVLVREALSSEITAETNSGSEEASETETSSASAAPFGIIPDGAERSIPGNGDYAEGATPAHPENPIAEGNRITAWVESEAIA